MLTTLSLRRFLLQYVGPESHVQINHIKGKVELNSRFFLHNRYQLSLLKDQVGRILIFGLKPSEIQKRVISGKGDPVCQIGTRFPVWETRFPVWGPAFFKKK